MNHLADATSPYLRQHRDNPVDWYPWGDDAFARAQALDRPILVSIGYSACHWCHVMAHESFEDDETAEILNEHFVAIKVDREERPDVDAIYMEAVTAISGHGGWPLNVFTTPEGRPFFGGTYFPKQAHAQLGSFKQVLLAVHDTWTQKRGELAEQAAELTRIVAARIEPPATDSIDLPNARRLLDDSVARFTAMFDAQFGGIGDAPKFPQAPMLELLLRANDYGHPEALKMVETTLSAMASGGIYDHLGGGFARYSVDRAWQIPHFEKMLYDQAALARLYLHAWQITNDPRWRQVSDETISYVLSELQNPDGGVCSSEDADSEGQEGKFYVFTKEEFDDILGPNDAATAAAWYGVSAGGNFEDHTNVLHRELIGDLMRPEQIESCRARLFSVRSLRVRPHKDDKVLTEWNAMFGVALCEAADATGNPRYASAAEAVALFLLQNLRRDDGRWLRSWRDDKAEHLGVASDYAWLLDFFTRLGTLAGRDEWIERALELARQLIDLFEASDGGLYTTGIDAETLVVRPREIYDGVTPAAGSVAANALIRLGALTDNSSLSERAQRIVNAAGMALRQSPIAFSQLVSAALSLDDPPIEVVIAGDRPDLVERAKRHYLPNGVITWGERRDSTLWQDRSDGFAYVCRFGECLSPVEDVEALDEAIDRATGTPVAR